MTGQDATDQQSAEPDANLVEYRFYYLDDQDLVAFRGTTEIDGTLLDTSFELPSGQAFRGISFATMREMGSGIIRAAADGSGEVIKTQIDPAQFDDGDDDLWGDPKEGGANG